MFGFSVDVHGKSGGLALLWHKHIDVTLQSFPSHHIDASISSGHAGDVWRFTGFYGEPDAQKRSASWELLRKLSSQSTREWVCMGDFNEVLYQHEKSGRSPRNWRLMSEFHNTLEECFLHDLGFAGEKFTWSNKREWPHTVQARLDRACASVNWSQRFPHARVVHLPALGSDHAPLILDTDSGRQMEYHPGSRRVWRFEAMWLRKEDCENVVSDAWLPSLDSDHTNSLLSNLERCRLGFIRWSKNSFGQIRKKVRQLERRIVKLRNLTATKEVTAEIRECTAEIERCLAQEEIMWKQRGKAQWLQEGDRNTKFFHTRASTRFCRNSINKLKNNCGVWCHRKTDIQSIITEYFSSLFTSSNPAPACVDEVVRTVTPKVTNEMNQMLCEPYFEVEVVQAISHMSPYKSPGPDGLPPIFFHKFWHLIGKSVTQVVLDILNRLSLDASLNSTHIVLITKCDEPESISQFRPISLCNVIIRIASKCVANRIKPFMNSIISDSQSAFIPGRLITDNILVAYELNHFLKSKTGGQKGFAAIKLDMSKAYDRVEWPFLENMLSRLGFQSRLVSLIMLLVSTVSFSFILSGENIGEVAPHRGLRQGDPLSPYLFLFCSEALSGLFREAENSNSVKGVKIARNAPCISHLLFADDTLVFCEASLSAMQEVSRLLSKYEAASGQKVNLEKSSMVLSRNVEQFDRVLFAEALGIKVIEKHEKYLGLPAVGGRFKREMFDGIHEKIWKCIQGWNSKLLNQAGKEVLIKAVLQSIPSYAMSCFKLPLTFVRQLESMMADFWWNDKGEHRTHWVAWSCQLTKSTYTHRDLCH
ncbi:UNVERIFIED_CONTAM: putative mitochondrial protein [Sesamum angustifolium]|uniref:Mitochondrial protein n=1 Tax=Sesamum angustifolium TaxID=2727405 RepID=A0AAW2L9X4_9LAMI